MNFSPPIVGKVTVFGVIPSNNTLILEEFVVVANCISRVCSLDIVC